MGDGTKLAIAILVFWGALVFFFFAFHPGGVSGVSNPGQMLKWLADEFAKLSGGSSTASTTAATVSATNTNALNYPGYTDTSSVGSANANPVTVV